MKKALGITGVCLLFPLLAMAGPDVPGKTVADDVLKQDIVQRIDEIQKAMAPQCEYTIVDTRVKTVFEMSSGRKIVLEEWVVKNCGQEIVYPIELKERPGGGVDATVSLPRVPGSQAPSTSSEAPARPS